MGVTEEALIKISKVDHPNVEAMDVVETHAVNLKTTSTRWGHTADEIEPFINHRCH